MSRQFFLHLQSLIQQMGQESAKSGDFVLICEGKKIKCHKVRPGVEKMRDKEYEESPDSVISR